MLRQANCVKSALNTAGLTLQADVGESFLIKCIFVGVVTTAGFLKCKIDNFTVGFWRVLGKRGNELGGQRAGYFGYNLMQYLNSLNLPFTYPIAEGQKFVIDALDGAGFIQVLYDIYDAGDIRADFPNGTQSKKFAYINYLRETTVIAASGDMLLDMSNSPAEFPDFPAGRAVPAKMKIKLHGIHGSPFADFTSGSNGFYTTYLKLVRDREVLLDEDRDGLVFLGNASATGAGDYTAAYSLVGCGGEQIAGAADYRFDPPFMFKSPLEFMSGEELLVYLTLVKVGTHTLAADCPSVGLIMEAIRE